MSSINIFQNVVVDRDKIADLVGRANAQELRELLGVKASQMAMMRRGERGPSVNGLLRLMMFYNLKPEDLATTK